MTELILFATFCPVLVLCVELSGCRCTVFVWDRVNFLHGT